MLYLFFCTRFCFCINVIGTCRLSFLLRVYSLWVFFSFSVCFVVVCFHHVDILCMYLFWLEWPVRVYWTIVFINFQTCLGCGPNVSCCSVASKGFQSSWRAVPLNAGVILGKYFFGGRSMVNSVIDKSIFPLTTQFRKWKWGDSRSFLFSKKDEYVHGLYILFQCKKWPMTLL